MNLKKILFYIFVLLPLASINAQVKKPIAKFKQPKITVYLGGLKDSSFIAPAQFEEIIRLPLKFVDEKKDEKSISSYNILYKKKVVSEDEETGKVYNTTTIKNALLRATPLPILWVNALTENPKPGEEIWFYDIIVKDKQGRLMYAPNYKLYIK